MVSCNLPNPIFQLFPFKVLVVDDDCVHLSTVAKALSTFGYQVVQCRSPESALVSLKGGQKFDIVVYVLTSNPSFKVAFRGILSGASQCMAKPLLDPKTLKDIWQHVIHRRRDELMASLRSTQTQRRMSTTSSKASSWKIGQEAVIATPTHRGGGLHCSNPTVFKRQRGRNNTSNHLVCEPTIRKKTRFIWRDAYEKILSMKILQYIRSKGVPNVTRENVGSHFQKYWLYMKRYIHKIAKSSKVTSRSAPTNHVTKEIQFQSSKTPTNWLMEITQPRLEPLLGQEDNFSPDFSHSPGNEIGHCPTITSNQVFDADGNLIVPHSDPNQDLRKGPSE